MTISTRISPPRSSQHQRGATLLLALLFVVLGLATLVTLRADRKGPEMEAERKTALALAQAKEAILGRAVINGIASGGVQNPGALPCPDRDNDGGIDNSGSICSGGPPVAVLPLNTGRLPWKTLGVGDFRDAAAERLWYVVDPQFFDNGSAMNSAMMPTLAVNGNPVVAVVIAPGSALAGQQRDIANQNNLASYLESYVNATTINLNQPSATYNDRILTITARELFTVVTFRMARELSLTAYTGAMGSTIESIEKKPSVWTMVNNWNAAVDTNIDASGIVASEVSDPNPGITPKLIKLKFLNCNVTYTITGPGNVTRDRNFC